MAAPKQPSGPHRSGRRHMLPAVLAAAVAAIGAACGVSAAGTAHATTPGHPSKRPPTEPAACRHLTPVRTGPGGSIPPPTGPYAFPTSESFGSWTPGAPYIVATLDDSGVHFSPAGITAGEYNVCFVDARTHRTHANDVVLDFYFDNGPLLMGLSVKAGTIGSDMLCPVLSTPGLTIGDVPVDLNQAAGSLSIAPGADCPTDPT